ncbi:hypothetical protein [Pseudomonas sp. PD9R]|nr:hypothetical protein [Pseudomonas sp. PD9R]
MGATKRRRYSAWTGERALLTGLEQAWGVEQQSSGPACADQNP